MLGMELNLEDKIMMTRETIIQGMTNNVARQIKAQGAKCFKIRTRLCEACDFIYTIENGVLHCYLMDEDGLHGDNAKNLTDSQLWLFADEFMQMAERACRRQCQSVKAREFERAREEMRRVLTNK